MHRGSPRLDIFIIVYFKRKRDRKDNWFIINSIDSIFENHFENGLFDGYGAPNVNIVKYDLFYTIIASEFGGVFGGYGISFVLITQW